MTILMNAALTEIGRRLKASYRPALVKPLPSKLEELVSRLGALDLGK